MISPRDFDSACQAFRRRWNEKLPVDKGWDWELLPERKLLKRWNGSSSGVLRMKGVEKEIGSLEDPIEHLSEDTFEEVDEAEEPIPKRRNTLGQETWEFCIKYDEVYQVPCLIVEPRCEGSLMDVDRMLHSLQPGVASHLGTRGHLASLTLEEHPITRMPCYALHPCQTQLSLSALLKPAFLAETGASQGKSNGGVDAQAWRPNLESEEERVEYMLAFYSLIQDVVGIMSSKLKA